ncbi:MAG: recombinase family protein, partial [Verrucomicrobiaceae bacterium]
MPAAEYIRMSTEMQDYSGVNQQAAIRQFAEANGYAIVRTYADEGRSGLHLKGRAGLQSLPSDVATFKTPFSAIIVYDISRWGRFQDADESAYYEFFCRKAGLKVIYCAEPFADDGSAMTTIFKSIRRVMAGEYSRDLSDKIFKGQHRMTERGFRQGGPPGYGLRRMRIDAAGEFKGLMNPGEHKSIKTDRTVLVPGPALEVDVVRQIFQLCADGRTPRSIVNMLNNEGIPAIEGRRWTYHRIRLMLTSEKYMGTNVYNRVSSKLGGARVPNPPEVWARKDGAFEPVISADLFQRVQASIAANRRSPPDEVLLDRLREMLTRKGFLSARVIDDGGGFTAGGYSHRFGSLFDAYALIDYAPAHIVEEARIMTAIKSVREKIGEAAAEVFTATGVEVKLRLSSGILSVVDETSIAIQVHRCATSKKGDQVWDFWFGLPI